MKATALIAAATLAFGTAAAMAQQQDQTSRTENSASADTMKPADDAQRTKNAVKNLGQKTRNAMHRAGDKVRHMAHNDKDKAGHHERHARADRHDRDTRAMGAPAADMRDTEAARRHRMDEAYANWKSRQKNG